MARQFLRMDQPLRYRIEVQGRIEERWWDWLDGMQVTVENGESARLVTTLTGTVADQAALQGLIRRLYDLRFPLLSVTCLDVFSEGQF